MSAKVCSRITFILVVLLKTAFLWRSGDSTKIHNIHWNTSSPIFRIDNTDHIIDVNKGNIPYEYDQVNIICPTYSEDTSDDDAEKYIIYNVSKEEYDTCRITNPSPRVIAVCDKPYKLMYFTITFRSFTPQPGGLEFRPGQDYYFICFQNHRGSTATTISTTKSTTTTTPESTTTTASTSLRTTSYKTTSYKTAGSHVVKNTTTKKTVYTKKPDPRENEIVKNEELTLSRSNQAVPGFHIVWFCTIVLLCLPRALLIL